MNDNDDIDLDNLIDEIEGNTVDEKEEDKAVEFKEPESEGKIKKSKDWWINRIMAAGGILIIGFTIFYAFTFYGLFSGKENKIDAAETTSLEPETTTQDNSNYQVFESPYSDVNILEQTKKLLNEAVLNEGMVTGINAVDNQVYSLYQSTCLLDKTQYEQVRNVYDYMLYNFRKKNSGYIDEDEVQNFCSEILLKSDFDKLIAYRANRILGNSTGTSGDYASAFALVLRKMGFEAYYIDDEIETVDGYSEHGYTVVKIKGQYYIFDLVAEKDLLDKQNDNLENKENKEIAYDFFGIALDKAGNDYTKADIEEAVGRFEDFITIPTMSFEVMISNKSKSVFGSLIHQSASYSEGNTDMAEGDLSVMMGDTINLAGNVSSTGGNNTWRLTAKIYDRDMNYINEYEIYKQTTSSAYNETSFTTTEGGYVQLQYSVTDIYDRTCTVTYLFKIMTENDFTTTLETETTQNQTTDTQKQPTSNNETETVKETETDEKKTDESKDKDETTKEQETQSMTNTESYKPTDDENETTSSEETEPITTKHKTKREQN